MRGSTPVRKRGSRDYLALMSTLRTNRWGIKMNRGYGILFTRNFEQSRVWTKNWAMIRKENYCRRRIEKEGFGLLPRRSQHGKNAEEIPVLQQKRFPNVAYRDFSAGRPFEKILTDITEFGLRDGKVYLSQPSIASTDAHCMGHRDVPGRQIGQRDASQNRRDRPPKDSHPAIHSDRGCHYRWLSWIDLMAKQGSLDRCRRKAALRTTRHAKGSSGR